MINISKIKSIYTNISDVTTVISGSNSIYEDQGILETRCRTKIHTGTYNGRCLQNATGITDYNDTLNKIVSTNYKVNQLFSNSVDASIVVQSNNGICSINAGILNLGTNSDGFSASTIVIGSKLSTIYLRLERSY